MQRCKMSVAPQATWQEHTPVHILQGYSFDALSYLLAQKRDHTEKYPYRSWYLARTSKVELWKTADFQLTSARTRSHPLSILTNARSTMHPNFLRISSIAQDCNENGFFASPGDGVIPGTQWISSMGHAQREDNRKTKLGLWCENQEGLRGQPKKNRYYT